MDDMNAAPIAPTTNSTIIDSGDTRPSGGGIPKLTPDAPPPAKESVRASLEAAAKNLPAEDDKAETEKAEKPVVKAEVEPKPVKVEKPAEKNAAPVKEVPEKGVAETAPEDDGRERQSEGRKHPEPPARFLPKEKEKWYAVPNEVKAAVSRLSQEHESEVAKYREAGTEYESLKPFVERAKAGGTDLKTALGRYVGMEDTFRQDPARGFQTLLQNMSMTPQKAISEILRAYNIQPQQLAAHIGQNPTAYTALAPAPQQTSHQPQQRQNPEVDALRQELTAMRTQMTAQAVIEPFRAQHPRYDELQDDIAMFLKSGKIPSTLAPAERLEAAYDMAERINPRSQSERYQTRDSLEVDETTPVADLRGTKSVKSAPGGVSETVEPQRKQSIRDMLEDEVRRFKRA